MVATQFDHTADVIAAQLERIHARGYVRFGSDRERAAAADRLASGVDRPSRGELRTHRTRHEEAIAEFHSIVKAISGRFEMEAAAVAALHGQVSTVAADEVTALLFDEGDRAVTVHKDGAVRRWEIGAPEADELPAGARLGTAAIHGDLIILSDVQGNWQAVNLDTEETVHDLRFGHAGGIIRMAVSTATGKMATAGRDGTIKLWDLNDGTELMALTDPGPPVSSLAFSSDGQSLRSTSPHWSRSHVPGLPAISRKLSVGSISTQRGADLVGAGCI
jgi:hypothetical protein